MFLLCIYDRHDFHDSRSYVKQRKTTRREARYIPVEKFIARNGRAVSKFAIAKY
jgi:hypothetical protein